MKKTMILLGATALTLASCSQEDVLYVNQKADNNVIAFTARTSKTTRAKDFTTDNLESFMVFGLKGDMNEESPNLTEYFGQPVEFKKQNVPMADANGVLRDYFTSDTPYYYPTDNSPITVMAFAPTTLTGVAGWTTDGKFTITNYTVKDSIDKQEDIIAEWVALWRPTLEEMEDEDIAEHWYKNDIVFEHALTKVFVSSASNSDTRYKYEVAGVKLGNVAKTGSCVGRQAFHDDEDPENSDPEGIDNKYFKWTVDENSVGDFTYIFDEPIEISNTGKTSLMSYTGEKGSFLMLPQQLKAEIVSENPESESVVQLEMKDGVAYVALLIRITYNQTGEVVYPYAEGVEAITETIGEGDDAVEYAWAAFPVASEWQMQRYVDYYVDFSKGAGYVAPGADSKIEFTPILGEKIIFFENVWSWDPNAEEYPVPGGNDVTLTEGAYEGVVNTGSVSDPFGD